MPASLGSEPAVRRRALAALPGWRAGVLARGLTTLWAAASVAAGVVWSLPSLAKQDDLSGFILSAFAALHGMDPYVRYPATLGWRLLAGQLAPQNLNPPISLLIFAPLTLLAPLAAAWAWYLLSLGFLLACVGLLCRAYPRHAMLASGWALSLYATWNTLALGQMYALLALLVVAAWVALRGGRRRTAGLLIGAAVALKPPFLVWPALLALRGDRQTPAWAAGGAVAVTLAPAAFFGLGILPRWVVMTRDIYLPSMYPGAMSLWVIADRVGFPLAGALASAALVAALGWWAWRWRPDPLRLSAAALCAALLASPITWLGYVLVLLPLGYAYASRGGAARAIGVLLTTPLMALLTVFVDSGIVPHPPLLVSGTACGLLVLGLLAALAIGAHDDAPAANPLPRAPADPAGLGARVHPAQEVVTMGDEGLIAQGDGRRA